MSEIAGNLSGQDDLPESELLRPWQVRVGRAEAVIEAFARFLAVGDLGEAEAERWLARLDRKSHVGARHHFVPRFMLDRWAVSDRVSVYSKLEQRHDIRNVRDLAIKDFYTFIDTEGKKDSSMESILGEVEKSASDVFNILLNPFVVRRELEVWEVATLAQLAAFQTVRTPRHRREVELHAEWYAKTIAEGHIPDARLRGITITPHQNDAIRMMGEMAQKLTALLSCRPVALVVLDRSRLLIGDDPLIVNAGPDDGTHHADCFMTDEEFGKKLARERRKKKGRRRRQVSRIIHFSSTVPRGLGTALEVVLPVSPRAALVWGPLQDAPYAGDVIRERLDESESKRFADLANDATCNQSLDWVVSVPSDTEFRSRAFPPSGPLMRVCGGESAASLAVNEMPRRMRPARLW